MKYKDLKDETSKIGYFENHIIDKFNLLIILWFTSIPVTLWWIR